MAHHGPISYASKSIGKHSYLNYGYCHGRCFGPNHCSRHHPFFKEAQANPSSPYVNWFYFTNWPHEYLSFLSVSEIPKLNLNNALAKEHIIKAALYWLSIGFDGFRLDHVIGPSHSFWRDFRKQIKDRYPKTVLIGEAWMMGIKRRELRTIHIKNKYLKFLFYNIPPFLFFDFSFEVFYASKRHSYSENLS